MRRRQGSRVAAGSSRGEMAGLDQELGLRALYRNGKDEDGRIEIMRLKKSNDFVG